MGVNLTPAEIVRLNDYALRATRGAEAAGFVNARRVAWADPETPFFEPSIECDIWLRDVACVWWCGASLTLAHAWACANANKPGFFEQHVSEKKTRRLIEQWQRGLTCTVRQLETALDYALYGLPLDAPETARGGHDDMSGCPYTDTLAEGVAAGMGSLAAYPNRMAAEFVMRWTKNQIALAGGKPGAVNARTNLHAWAAYDDYVGELEKRAVKT